MAKTITKIVMITGELIKEMNYYAATNTDEFPLDIWRELNSILEKIKEYTNKHFDNPNDPKKQEAADAFFGEQKNIDDAISRLSRLSLLEDILIPKDDLK